MPLTGKQQRTIDSKGRLIVPSRLRDELGTDRVVLAKHPDGCVALWTEEKWNELIADIVSRPRGDSNARELARDLGETAHTDGFDRQGRITIPQELRGHAGIEREVMVIGALDHGELWSLDGWQQRQEDKQPDDLKALWAQL